MRGKTLTEMLIEKSDETEGAKHEEEIAGMPEKSFEWNFIAKRVIGNAYRAKSQKLKENRKW